MAVGAVFRWPASSRRADPYSRNSELGQRILITVTTDRTRWENVPQHTPAPGHGDHPLGVRDIRGQCHRSSRITGIIRGDGTPGQSLVDHLQGKVFTDLQGNCWGPDFKTIKKQKPIHALCYVHRLDLSTTNKTFRRKLKTPQKLILDSRDQW